MTEPRWDDDRLHAAFADRFDGPAPEGLAADALARIRSGSSASPRRTGTRTWAALAAAALVLAMGLGTRIVGDGSATDAHGLPIRSVAETLALRASGSSEPLAVRGYYVPPPAVRCPPRLSAAINPVRLDCPRNFSWLLDSPEPLPAVADQLPDDRLGFHPVFPGLDVSNLHADRYNNDLVEVVLVGHFHDRRARLCDVADATACDTFVVDAIHSIGGEPQPPSTIVDLEPYEGEPRPEPAWTATEAERRAQAIAPSLDILSRVALPGHRVAELEPSLGTGVLGIIDQPVVWVLNGLAREETGVRLRTLLLIDDDTVAYEAAGWEESPVGFVAVSPPTEPDGSPEPVDPGFPMDVLGLPVVSVSEAIELRDAGPDGTEIAVRGWMSTPFPMSCPAPIEPLTPVELGCPEAFTSWLTERPEPTWERLPDGMRGFPPSGPAIQPVIRAEVPRDRVDGVVPGDSGPAPFPVVLVGHFDDDRSVLCPDVAACRRNFVVDARVWMAGAAAGQEVIRLDGEGAAARMQPHQAAGLATAAGRAAADPWVALVGSSSIAAVDPRIAETAGLADAPLIWVVRMLERDADGFRARTYFVDDSTGDVFRSTRAGVVLTLGAGERVVDVGDGVRVRITDRTGTLTDARPLGAEVRPEDARLVDGHDDPPAYLWLKDGQPTVLAIEWAGSPCDTDWSLVIRNPSPWIVLDHPEIGACPSVPARRGMALTFETPVRIEDVGLTLDSPYRPD